MVAGIYMAWRWSKNCVTRSQLLITVGCVLLSLTPANGAPHAFSLAAATEPLVTDTKTASTESPPRSCPLDTEAERPDPVRRFLSWVIQGITRPFRRRPPFGCQLPPTVVIQASNSSITLPCPRTTTVTASGYCPISSEVTLLAAANHTENHVLLFTWSVTGGRLRGKGHSVTWDLSGVPVGTYTATVEVNDGNNHITAASATVTVSSCANCETP